MSQPSIVISYDAASDIYTGIAYVNNRRAFVATDPSAKTVYNLCVTWWNEHPNNTELLENPEPMELLAENDEATQSRTGSTDTSALEQNQQVDAPTAT